MNASVPLIDGHISDGMGANAHPWECGSHVVVMPESLLYKCIQKLETRDVLELKVVEYLALCDLFPHCSLVLGVEGEVVEAHSHQVCSGVGACHEEHHELINQLIHRVALLCIQQPLLVNGLQHCPLLLPLLC